MIDYEELRKNLSQDALGDFYGGGFGGALIQAEEIKKLPRDKLLEYARKEGININNYMY